MKKLVAMSLLMSIGLVCMHTPAQAKFINKFKRGFYFEKYKTADDAKAALLQLHPIGSDVDALVKTLEKAGAKIEEIPKKEIYDAWIQEGATAGIGYDYFENKLIYGYKWGGAITYNEKNEIIDYGLSKHYEGL
jgi:hypothetical protein